MARSLFCSTARKSSSTVQGTVMVSTRRSPRLPMRIPGSGGSREWNNSRPNSVMGPGGGLTIITPVHKQLPAARLKIVIMDYSICVRPSVILQITFWTLCKVVQGCTRLYNIDKVEIWQGKVLGHFDRKFVFFLHWEVHSNPESPQGTSSRVKNYG